MGLTKRLSPGTRTDVRAPPFVAIPPLTLACAPRPLAARASRHNRVGDWWVTFAVKRTKSATKRTSDPVEMRVSRGRALHSLIRDMASLRPCRPHADTTYIDTNNRISLASGRTLSKATLFRLLHLGGWIGLGIFVGALNSSDIWPLPSGMSSFTRCCAPVLRAWMRWALPRCLRVGRRRWRQCRTGGPPSVTG